jgi:hypothetical protein
MGTVNSNDLEAQDNNNAAPKSQNAHLGEHPQNGIVRTPFALSSVTGGASSVNLT